jgi:hypothetical protein
MVKVAKKVNNDKYFEMEGVLTYSLQVSCNYIMEGSIGPKLLPWIQIQIPPPRSSFLFLSQHESNNLCTPSVLVLEDV